MRILKRFTPLLFTGIVSGCSNLQGLKLLAPESFGLIPVSPDIYVEAGADEMTRARLRKAMVKAENAIRTAYGDVYSRPIVNACISEECYQAFGGRGSRAKVYGDRILLSPRALNWHFLAHEWSHDEIRTRLTFNAWWHMPQWFDEGVAIVISEAPEYSDEHWQYLVTSNISRPTPEELHNLKSLRQWLDAVHLYGEIQNNERKAGGEAEVRPVYTAAGNELRPWLKKAGSAGLLAFIQRLNDGEEFVSAYQSANNAVERDAPQAVSPLTPRP
jgi:hypothetical protein